MKSRRQAAIMKKNFYFLFMNTIIVPLSVNTTLSVFYSEIKWEDLDYKKISEMIMSNFAGLVFITLCINWTFISNGVTMLDIVHHIFKFFMYMQHKKAQSKEEHPMPFIDDYPFDHGYFQALAIVVFSLGLIFSAVLPPVSFFLTIYFFFKYNIDKYNLVLVYNREFESGGIIVRKQVLPLLFLSLYLFQILNTIYFNLKDPRYLKGGSIFLSIQTLAILFLHTFIKNRRREDKVRLMHLEQYMYEEN